MYDKHFLNFIEAKSRSGEPISIVTKVDSDGSAEKFIIAQNGEAYPDGAFDAIGTEISAAAKEMMARRKRGSIIHALTDAGQKVTYAIDVLLSMPSLIVFGAGHVGQAVASIAALAGYNVTVVDDRDEFVSRRRLPDARITLTRADFADAVNKLTISHSSAVIIVTRGHQHDEVCLRGVIRSEAGYIGMIGSKRRVVSVFERLKNDGVPASLLERVHAPIGLKIGATSPQEIAVAIIAEVISFFNSESKPDRS